MSKKPEIKSRRPLADEFFFAVQLLFIGLVLYAAVVIWDHARSWTDLKAGLINGTVHFLMLYWIVYLFLFCPVFILVFALTKNRIKSDRHRSLVCLSPILLILTLNVAHWILYPATDRRCFANVMKFEMPATAENILSVRSGGGITDYSYCYYFAAEPNEIREMLKQKPFTESSVDFEWKGLEGWPESRKWDGREVYRFDDGHWYFTIHVSGDYSQALVFISCI